LSSAASDDALAAISGGLPYLAADDFGLRNRSSNQCLRRLALVGAATGPE